MNEHYVVGNHETKETNESNETKWFTRFHRFPAFVGFAPFQLNKGDSKKTARIFRAGHLLGIIRGTNPVARAHAMTCRSRFTGPETKGPSSGRTGRPGPWVPLLAPRSERGGKGRHLPHPLLGADEVSRPVLLECRLNRLDVPGQHFELHLDAPSLA